jgi:hypothetical protein
MEISSHHDKSADYGDWCKVGLVAFDFYNTVFLNFTAPAQWWWQNRKSPMSRKVVEIVKVARSNLIWDINLGRGSYILHNEMSKNKLLLTSTQAKRSGPTRRTDKSSWISHQ